MNYYAAGAFAFVAVGGLLAYRYKRDTLTSKLSQTPLDTKSTTQPSSKSLTPQQEDLIIAQWEIASKDAEGTAKLFYGHLFQAFPQVRHMFKTNDFVAQGRKLTGMITMVVKKIKKINEMDDYLFRMGKLHVPFGVKPEHYPIVGANLLWTLETAFGSQWNQESKEAWSTFYNIIAEKMIKGHLAVECDTQA